jgi:dihydrofolate reductase
MRKLIATVFNYSLDGLLADEGTEFWKFCFDLPENREPNDPAQLDFLQSADAHIMGRTAYEGIAGSMTTSTDHPFAPILNAARKVVFSRTLKTADWANTTIAAGDTAEEIDKLRQGGEGHIVVWGGVSLWRSLIHGRSGMSEWAHLGLNQGPLACEASALPLSYAPGSQDRIAPVLPSDCPVALGGELAVP